MIRNGEPSWSVIIDGAEELNFAIFVGCTYNVLPLNKPFSLSRRWSSCVPALTLTTDQRGILTEQWLAWWNSLLSSRFSLGHIPAFFSQSYVEFLDKELAEICTSAWQAFREWWHMPAGGNTAMIHCTSADDVGRYVREFEREAGRKAKPFRMKVDLVYAGLGEIVEVNDQYTIMPAHAVGIESKSWWTQKLRTIG